MWKEQYQNAVRQIKLLDDKETVELSFYDKSMENKFFKVEDFTFNRQEREKNRLKRQKIFNFDLGFNLKSTEDRLDDCRIKIFPPLIENHRVENLYLLREILSGNAEEVAKFERVSSSKENNDIFKIAFPERPDKARRRYDHH